MANTTVREHVYVCWNIPITEQLKALQTSICHKYNLVPRDEMHVTLGYIGYAGDDKIVQLAEIMKAVLSGAGSSFDVHGIGGAVNLALPNAPVKSVEVLLTEKNIDTIQVEEHQRVMWVSLIPTHALESFEKQLHDVVGKIGLSNKFIEANFYPHITLGSNRSSTQPKHAQYWDVHDLDKRVTFEDAPLPHVESDKIHVTDTNINPDSLAVIKSFG